MDMIFSTKTKQARTSCVDQNPGSVTATHFLLTKREMVRQMKILTCCLRKFGGCVGHA